MSFDDERRWIEIEAGRNIWSYNKSSSTFFPMRMIALKLNDGSILVYSPVPSPEGDCLKQLAQFGTVKFLLAPNYFHNLGLRPFLEHFPGSQVVASRQAISRLKKVTGVTAAPTAVIADKLPTGVSVIEPEGLKTGEIWLTANLKLGCAWILCDAFFNINKVPTTPFGFSLRLGGTAPGLRVSRVFRLIGIKDKSVYRKWLADRAGIDQPKLIIPSHGEILELADLSRRLTQLVG